MKRPLSLIIFACLYLFSVLITVLPEALAHYRRGDINDGHNTLLRVVLWVVICIGLLRLRWWAWLVSMLYFGAGIYLLGVSVWHGKYHPVYLLLAVPQLIVLFSDKVLQAFFPTVEGDNLGSGKITASTSSEASPVTETKIEDVDDPSHTPASSTRQSSEIIAILAAILSGLQLLFSFLQPFYNHFLKQYGW